MNFKGDPQGPTQCQSVLFQVILPCFQGISVWTNGAESLSIVSPETGIGSLMALFPGQKLKDEDSDECDQAEDDDQGRLHCKNAPMRTQL